MKGRRQFSRSEAERIRALLDRIRKGERNVQKRLRDRLRNECEFYISDFDGRSRGFTRSDFDALVSSGAIDSNG